MADEMNLDLEHPDYQAIDALRTKSRDLWSGEKTVMDAGETYLFKTTNESTTDYEIRTKRAYYKNWPAAVINARQAVLWRKEPERELPPKLEAHIDNVDTTGLSADSFFANITEAAEVDGMTWVVVDKTAAVEGVISQEQAKSAGIRAYFRHILSEDVLDWQYGPDGKLNWIVMRQAGQLNPDRMPGAAADIVSDRLVWTRNDWTLFRAAEKGKGYVPIASGIHALGEVPAVPFYGDRIHAGYGKPVIKDILQHTIALYNKASDRDFAEFLCNNPKMYAIAMEVPEAVDMGSSKGVYIVAQPGVSQGLFYLEHSGNGIDATRQSEADLVRSLVEIALRQARKETAQVQAADGIKAERREFNASIASVAKMAEDSEQECWKLMALWEGEKGEPVTTYNRDFDDEAITSEMISTLSAMASAGQLTTETLLRIAKRGEIIPDDVDIDNEVLSLQNQTAQETERIMGALNVAE